MFQFYDLNILKLPKFPSYPKTYVANVHYISQCPLHLSMYITSLNAHYVSQCTLHLSMSITSLNVHYISQCTLRLSMYITSLNVHYISQCTLHSYYYNLMGPLSFMLSVVDRNVVMRRMTVHSSRETAALISPCATTAKVKAVLVSRLQCCPEPHTAHYCEPVPVPVLIAGSC